MAEREATCLGQPSSVGGSRRAKGHALSGVIPLGKLCILDGDPGLGRSTVLLDLAARVTTSGVMPDGTQGITGVVVILSAEDGEEDTIKPRLLAAGADEARVHVIGSVHDDAGERPLDIPATWRCTRSTTSAGSLDQSGEEGLPLVNDRSLLLIEQPLLHSRNGFPGGAELCQAVKQRPEVVGVYRVDQ
jgi:hypothetical protein